VASEEAIVLLHLLSLNETQRARGEPMTEVDADASVWGELTRIGAIDQSGAITAVGREILGEDSRRPRKRSDE
jgi:hypothetical protein